MSLVAVAVTICLSQPASGDNTEPVGDNAEQCAQTWLPAGAQVSGAAAGAFPDEVSCNTAKKQLVEEFRSRLDKDYKIEKGDCKPLAKPEMKFVEVAKGIHAHEGRIAASPKENRGDLSNIAFIIGDNSVLVIDSGGSFETGSQTWRAIRTVTDKPVSHVVLTHMHPDHVFGASALKLTGAQIIGHKNFNRAIAERASSYLQNYGNALELLWRAGLAPPKADIEVGEGAISIDLGNRVVRVKGWELAHTNNDLTVFDENTGYLFTGDLLFDRHIPVIDGSLRGWQKVIGELAGWQVNKIMAGHGNISLDFPQGFSGESAYLKTLADDTKRELENGTRLGDAVKIIGQSAKDKWQLFEDFNARNATVVYSELEWE